MKHKILSIIFIIIMVALLGECTSNPKHVSAMLCKYSKLKQDSYSKFTSDIYYMMLDLDKIATEALKNYPLY